MKNVRDSSKISTPGKKVKRLQPTVHSGNSLWEKLEPTLALARKQMKFRSPYKNPLIPTPLNKKPQRHQEENSSTTAPSDKTRTYTVKIKPIDPFKFCESFTEKSKKDKSKSVPAFQKSLKAQNKVNQEVLMLIQKTAATIKIIRKQNEEWKQKHQSMSFLKSIEEQHTVLL